MISLSNPFRYIATHKLGTSPGSTLAFDAYLSAPGLYQFILEASTQAADDLTLEMLIKPSPTQLHRTFISLPIPTGNKTLWTVDSPACLGVLLKFTQRAGLEKLLLLHVWRQKAG
uniref:Uncharacterized protein n=1 Tax=viral metagenome TaxID=1070528 RepID=A0A6M3INX5_9ZZZZ